MVAWPALRSSVRQPGVCSWRNRSSFLLNRAGARGVRYGDRLCQRCHGRSPAGRIWGIDNLFLYVILCHREGV